MCIRDRVYIPYLIVVIISALYFWLVCGQDVLNPLFGSVFLYKMFVPSLECAFGGQMWFVSTIIQFYLFWPLIVRLFRVDMGGANFITRQSYLGNNYYLFRYKR